jgi:hypothetical protein
LPLPASGGCWHSLAYYHVNSISASVVTLVPPLLSMSNLLCLSHKGTCDYIEGPPA